MRIFLKNRLTLVGFAVIVSAAIMAADCDDDEGDVNGGTAQPSATASDTGDSVQSTGSVAPNTFLVFEGDRYRLMELLQADLIDDSGFEEAGEASEADIDQQDLTVYRKAGDADALYTYAEPIENEVVGEGVPGLWYRWALEPQD